MNTSPDFAEQRRRIQAVAATPCRCGDQGQCLACNARRIDAQVDIGLYELVSAMETLRLSVLKTRRGRVLLWLVTKYVMLRSRLRRR